MKFNSLAKRAFLLISLCCLSAPAVAECSKDEYEFQTFTLKRIFTEQIDLDEKRLEAGRKFAKSNSSEDEAKYCQIRKRMNKINRAYLSVDTALEKSCPFIYNNIQEWKKLRDLHIKNGSILQREVDICTKRGF
jgi:hypothetical protein